MASGSGGWKGLVGTAPDRTIWPWSEYIWPVYWNSFSSAPMPVMSLVLSSPDEGCKTQLCPAETPIHTGNQARAEPTEQSAAEGYS